MPRIIAIAFLGLLANAALAAPPVGGTSSATPNGMARQLRDAHAQVETQRAQSAQLKSRVAELEQRSAQQSAQQAQRDREIAELKRKLAALKAHPAAPTPARSSGHR